MKARNARGGTGAKNTDAKIKVQKGLAALKLST